VQSGQEVIIGNTDYSPKRMALYPAHGGNAK